MNVKAMHLTAFRHTGADLTPPHKNLISVLQRRLLAGLKADPCPSPVIKNGSFNTIGAKLKRRVKKLCCVQPIRDPILRFFSAAMGEIPPLNA